MEVEDFTCDCPMMQRLAAIPDRKNPPLVRAQKIITRSTECDDVWILISCAECEKTLYYDGA